MTNYKNLSKQAKAKKALETLEKINDSKKEIKEGEKKGKVNLSTLVSRLAKKQLEMEKAKEEEEE